MASQSGTFVRSAAAPLSLLSELIVRVLGTITSIAFLLRMVCPPCLGRCIDVAVKVESDALSDGTPVYVYRRRAPVVRHRNRAGAGGLFLLHGLSASGAADLRVMQLASALSLSGLTVVVPHVEELKNLVVRPELVDRVADMIALASQRPDWCLKQQMNLCGPCISAGILLLAAERLCRKATSNAKVGAMLLIGPYASVASVYKWVFYNREADSYGRNSILLNSIRLLHMDYLIAGLPGLDCSVHDEARMDEVCLLLKAQLDDDHLGQWEDHESRVRASIGSVSSASRVVFRSLSNNLDSLESLAERIYSNPRISAFFELLSPSEQLKHLRAPAVVAIHGIADTVLPCSETLELALHLARACVHVDAVSYTITPFLGHGEQVDNHEKQASLSSYVFHALNLVAGFAAFFGACQRQTALLTKE